MSELIRLSICDCKTGICLFDLVWNENYVVIPSSLGSLITSFYQIGREFGDKGGVSSILMRPCSHRELFANSSFGSFGSSFNNFTDSVSRSPQLTTTRSASFPSTYVQAPLSPRERVSSPAAFLTTNNGIINIDLTSSIDTVVPTISPSPPLTLRASSLPSLPRPRQPSISIGSRSLAPVTSAPVSSPQQQQQQQQQPSRSPPTRTRPLLTVSNVNLNNSISMNTAIIAQSRDSTSFSDSSIMLTVTDASEPPTPTSSNPSTPTQIPSNPFSASSETPPSPGDSDTESKSSASSPPSPSTTTTSPSSPTLPDRISRLIGHHKRRVKSSSAAQVRLTLERDPHGDTVVAVMHVDNAQTVEFAKIYANAIMREFMDEYGFDIAHMRVTLDKIADSPPNQESLEEITSKFKEFSSFAEKIKTNPK